MERQNASNGRALSFPVRRWLSFFRRPPVRPLAKPPAPRWPLLLGVIAAVSLTFLLYGDTLGFPFLQEDSTHIRWLSTLNPIDPFLTARGAPDYRPLGKSIIKAWYLLLGEHDRVWLRFHNFVFNALNVALVAVLASWADVGRRRYWTAAFAALLFATLPFAYQAIPWINNFFYPLANLLLLLMTAVYWQARVRNSNTLLALALFLCFLAPFEIEYGLMAGGVLFTVEIVLWLQKRQPRPWLMPPLIGLGLNLLFLVRSLTIPKQTYAFGLPTPWRLVLIATYFLQGLLYPVTPLARPLMAVTGWGDVAAIWLVALPALLLIVVVLLRRRQIPLLVLGLLWFLLLNLPALVFVDFDYVVNSPRLLYPPGVAIAWLWGGFFATLLPQTRRRPATAAAQARTVARTAVVVALLALTLGVSVGFVRTRLDAYRLAERPALQLAEIARTTAGDDPLLIVNFPSWISPAQRLFAMGNHGAQIIPFYINIQELIYAHNDADHPARAVQFANVRREQPYYYGMLGEQMDYEALRAALDASGPVYVTQWTPTQLDLRYAGRTTALPAPETAVTFGEGIQLGDVTVTDDGATITVALAWRLAQRVDRDLTVFVHLYGPDGQLVAQADGYPLMGLAPFWLWEAGRRLEDVRRLTWPDDAPPGAYRLGVGVYDAAAGERLTAVDAGGARLADDVAIVQALTRPAQ